MVDGFLKNKSSMPFAPSRNYWPIHPAIGNRLACAQHILDFLMAAIQL